MTTKSTGLDLTGAQLIEVVRTGREIGGVGKVRALAELQRRDRRNRKDVGNVLSRLAADRSEAPRFRHMASMGLYMMGGAQGARMLAAAAENADEVSASTIATGLGRVGTVDHLASIERLASISAPGGRSRAKFAATLLAYRYGLDGHDVRTSGSAFQELGRSRSQLIKIGKARANVAANALAELADEPLEIDLTTDRALQIICEPNSFVWLWTKRTVGGTSLLAERKGVAGVLFRKRHFENAYALSTIALGTPMRTGVRLTIHQVKTGTVIYSGTVTADGSLELRALDRPGLAAIHVDARVDAGLVEVETAKSATVAHKARIPKLSSPSGSRRDRSLRS
jgi:hypothetical protein